MSQLAAGGPKPGPGAGRPGGPSFTEAQERALLVRLLDERLRFESLLARLSATFIHLPAEEVDWQIERGLQQIIEFLEIDRSSLAQFSEDGKELVVTHSYAAPGCDPFPRINIASMLPWYTAKLRRGELVRFTRLPDDLPPEAVEERKHYARGDMPQSHVAIPFKVGESVLGALGFGTWGKQHDWPDELVQSLQLVGEIFANALARKRADIAQRASEDRFRLMADTAPVMVWMSGPDKLCTFFNKDWLDFTGRQLEHEVGNGWSEGVHPDDLQRCLNTYCRAFDARQKFRMEYRLRRFDGAYRWILDTGVPRSKADGTFDGYIGSGIDITDQKQVEEDLRNNEARLRLLLESTHAIPWVADPASWRFTYVGSQASKLLGYPLHEWYQEGFWADHICPDDRAEALAHQVEHAGGRSNYKFEYRMVAADGSTVWIHHIVNVALIGPVKTLRGWMIDVSARRRAEEQSRNLREQLTRVSRVTTMGELTASIAHEVNQPLCAILSNAQAVQRLLAGDGCDLQEVREALADIIQDGQRAGAVLARIRGFLQKAPVQRSRTDFNVLIREVFALMRYELARRGVAVKLELADRLPPVLGDRVQLQQVILNLMGNGADAMDHVEKEFRELVLRSTADAAGSVTVAVQDAGTGVDSRNLGSLFDPFFTTKAGSIGMGLAICKSIVEAHGGKIGATPNPARGTTFFVTLPGIKESIS